MEVGTEISQKIRSAIKAKLMEYGAYVDDELPDYIMVMVANKRSRLQMNNDLGLFLGDNTSTFTAWLHTLLGKLQTIKSDTDKSADKQGKAKTKGKKKNEKHSGDSVAKRKASSSGSDRKSEGPGETTQDSGKNTFDSLAEKGQHTITKSKNVQDVEDMRQLLVAEAPGDAIADELETTETEVVNSRTITITKRSPSQEQHVQSSAVVRKRKASTSVLADVSKEGEEAYDPVTVKVTTCKSSLPSLQANRALLLKAMTEAEHCIALKRNVAMTKPVGHDSSAAEMYCPKRKCSDQSHEESPPPYIPSRKNSVDQSSMSGCISQQYEARVLGHNDVRHTLSREDCRELISRYRREELLRTIGIVRDSSYQLKSFRSHERGRRSQEGNKDFTSERKVKSDNSSAGVKNFQITTRVVPSGLRSVSDCHDSKEEQRSSSPEQSLQVTLSPVPNKDSRISITARLGKVVVERKEDFPEFENTGETIHSRVSYSQFSTEHKDSSEDVIPKGGQSKLKTSLTGNSGDGQVISSSGRAAVKRQHEADVISLQAARPSRKAKRHSIPDNRIVHNDVYTHSHVDGNVEENNESLGDIAAVAIKSGHLKEIPSAMVRAWDSSANQDEDLAQMIDRDPRPELQGDIHTGECTLHLDGGGTSHVVEGEKLEKGINRHEKVEKKFGTRFIVTLDGVDERQFSSEDSSVSDKLIRPAPIPTATVTASNLQQLKQKLLLDFPAVKNRPVSETLLQQVQTLRPTAVVPCKLTPPKIQPFSISLQDSDDEHHEERRASASKQDSSHLIKEVKEEDSEISALKRAKMSERCKFWPACAAGHSCEYRHPTTQCKTFPNCKFGDTCLFIHPKCRFDSNCTRPECPYAHTSHRSALAEAAHVIAIPPPHFVFSPAPHKPHFLGSSFPSSQTMCHYFPNCQNMNCPFLHPKQCRFGTACRNPACPFYHPPVRTSRRKWQAHHVQQRSQVATLLASVKMEHTFPRISSSAKQSHSTVSSTSQ